MKFLSIVAAVLVLSFIALASQAVDPCVNINTAPKEELEKIKHIGEIRAEQIIKLRREKLFSSVDELDRIIGIGPSRISDIKEQGLACVSGESIAEVGHQQDIQQDLLAATTVPSAEVGLPRPKPEPVVYPSDIVINELLPSPDGSDETEEWIEISNRNDFEVDLSGWQISDTAGKTQTYVFPDGSKISSRGFLVVSRPESKITLNNNGDGLKIFQPQGVITDEISYSKALLGQSFNRTDSGWTWSAALTPGSQNQIPALAAALLKKEGLKEKTAQEENLAEVLAPAEEFLNKEGGRSLLLFLFAPVIAILSGSAILLLKKKIKN